MWAVPKPTKVAHQTSTVVMNLELLPSLLPGLFASSTPTLVTALPLMVSGGRDPICTSDLVTNVDLRRYLICLRRFQVKTLDGAPFRYSSQAAKKLVVMCILRYFYISPLPWTRWQPPRVHQHSDIVLWKGNSRIPKLGIREVVSEVTSISKSNR